MPLCVNLLPAFRAVRRSYSVGSIVVYYSNGIAKASTVSKQQRGLRIFINPFNLFYMKTNYFLCRCLLVMFLSLALFSSCKKKNENVVKSELTADESKQHLQEVAEKFMSYFNTADQEEVIKLVDGLVEKMEDYSWDGITGYFEDELDKKGVYLLPRRVLSVMQQPSIDIALTELSANMFSGVFEANDRTHEWRRISEGNKGEIELRLTSMDGKPCVAVLTAKGDTYHWKGDESTEAWEIVVPEKVTFSFKADGKELASATVTFDAKLNDHVKVTEDISVANLKWSCKADVTMTKGDFSANLKCGSNEILDMTVSLPKYELISKSDSKTWEQWLDMYDRNYEYLMQSVGDVIAEVNIIKQVQLKGKVSDFGSFYKEYSRIEDEYWGEKRRRQLLYAFDDYVLIGMYYSSNTMQAHLTGELIDGYIEPVIFFEKDKTSYSIEDFFSRGRFRSVYTQLEDLINSYIHLFRYMNIEEVEL